MNLRRGWSGILLAMALVMPQVTSAAVAAGTAPAAEVPALCVWRYCATQRQLDMAGLVLGAAAVGTAVVAYTMGPHAAMATAGGFLVFGHFLFDVVPLAIGGVAAWIYGPQVWEWLGFKRAAKEAPPAGT
jgi:hypothetical protein